MSAVHLPSVSRWSKNAAGVGHISERWHISRMWVIQRANFLMMSLVLDRTLAWPFKLLRAFGWVQILHCSVIKSLRPGSLGHMPKLKPLSNQLFYEISILLLLRASLIYFYFFSFNFSCGWIKKIDTLCFETFS